MGLTFQRVAEPIHLPRWTARPRVMLLSTWHPVPVDNGRKQRTRGLIDALCDDYDIFLVSLLPDDQCQDELLPDVPGVWQQTALPLPVFDPQRRPSVADGLQRWPRSVAATWNQQTADAIVAYAQQAAATVAIGTDLRTLEYLRYLRRAVAGARTILDEPDVSPFVEIDPAARAVEQVRARLRRRRYGHYLRQAATELDAVLVAGPNEDRAYATLSGGHRSWIVPNGIQRLPEPWTPSGSTDLLYTGSVKYGPNLEAVSWYVRSILPLLRTQQSSPILTITGALPDDIPDVLKQPAIRLTGWLEDLDAVHRASGVFIAPIQSGTGTRVKILEAMATGMPVVTTSKGCEGIPLVSGKHALVADTPEEFTLAILKVLRDPVFAQELGWRGRAFVDEHASWRQSAEHLREIVAGLLRDRRGVDGY